MLNIKIFNVDHGFSAAISTGDDHIILLGCGYNSQTGFTSAKYLFQQRKPFLDSVILPAYSEDHLIAFQNFLTQCLEHQFPVNFFIANPLVDLTQFSQITVPYQPLNNILSLKVSSHPECIQISHSMLINEIKITFFWNNSLSFQNIHNLSLVTFLSYRDVQMIFPGNLEREGWRNLLQCYDFRERLKKVNIFVASAHGKEAGYCSEVFNYCTPEVVIISNHAGQSVTDQMMYQYKSHIKKSLFNISEKPLLTTEEDGVITITKYLDALRQVKTQSKVEFSPRI